MAMTTGNSSQLIRANLWSNELKETLQDELMGMKYVRMLDGFPDGTTFNIPSIGDARTDDYVEDTAVKFRPLDTGNYTFTISEYISSGHYITDQAKQDLFYASQLEASFVPKERRAIMEHFETTMFETPDNSLASSATDPYLINGVAHRFSGGSAVSGLEGQIQLADFSYANLALTKANVPAMNRVAIVPPEVAYIVENLTNITSLDSNPRWEGIVAEGISTGMTFVKNIFGFDVYCSNYLPNSGDLTNAPNALDKRDQSTAGPDFTSVAGKPCYFFSATMDILPWVAAWRQMPEVEYIRDGDNLRDKYLTTGRYGVQLYRPENMVICHTNTAVA